MPRLVLGTLPYGGVGIRNCTVPGTVVLTYDDGLYIYTANLLDILKQFGAKATFFVTGNNYGENGIDNAATIYLVLVRRMVEEGH